jgi:hypothetical protein
MRMIFIFLVLVSCGRRNDSVCRSRENMIVQCQTEMIPNYGLPYAIETCDRTYQTNRCY